MKQFVERAPKFDAIQFTGGKKNAKKVIKWLKGYTYDAGWHPQMEGEPMCGESTDERLLIFSRGGPAMHLPSGWWLVITDRNFKLERFSDDDFKLMWRPAKKGE